MYIVRSNDTIRRILKNRHLYLLLVLPIVYLLIFRYFPMYGLYMAFSDFKVSDGILGSEWVGLKHFISLFTSSDFMSALRNTVFLSFYSLVTGFPAPIILAILVNEVRRSYFKKFIQQVVYLPHFLSWIIVGGMIINCLSPNAGIVNFILQRFTGEKIYFMGKNEWWPTVFVLSGIWKEAGWGTIFYFAAIAGIDTQQYEAAIIDGASIFRQIWHITLPGISSTIIILLLLNLGGILNLGFEQVFALQNSAVIQVSEIIETFVYRRGIMGFQYSFTTAVGIFQSFVGLIFIVVANRISKSVSGKSIW